MRNAVIISATALWLAACASAPVVVRDGDSSALKGKALAALGGASAPADSVMAKSIEAGVLKRLGAAGADVSGTIPAAYLLQVGVGVSAPAVGIATQAGPSIQETAWRSAPIRRHIWSRRTPPLTATAVVLDVATGKPAAWASVRADRADPELLADYLARALAAAPGL